MAVAVSRHGFDLRAIATLAGQPGLPGDLLAAVTVAPGRLRLYLRAAVAPDGDAPGLLAVREAAPGCLALDLAAGPDGAARWPWPGGHPVHADPPQTAPFAGRRVMVGHCNGEGATVLRDWLVWHHVQHGADAALIIDRGRPEETNRLAADLAALLAQDAADGAAPAMPVVIAGFDAPMGVSGQGHEGEPFHTPDAPGKAQMAPPDPDPWHAALDYRLMFQMLRDVFLRDAEAVAQIEVIDLIAPLPPGATPLFAQAVAAPAGVVGLAGEMVYPWSVSDAGAGFGDHICRRFDAGAGTRRWVAAPARLPEGAEFMPNRVVGARPRDSLPFWRCMAIRHGMGAGKIGQIVPKASLIEAPDLLAMAAEFGATPQRVPTEAPAPAPAKNRVAIVTCMKNEGPFILEWLAWHRAIGVDDVLVYTNDCTDGTDDFLRLLASKGLCVWRDNPFKGTDMKPQHAALHAAASEPVIRDAGWLICMDVDEFIAVHTGDGTLGALFAAVPDANLISLTWRLFGNADIDAFEDGFITQSFTRCAREFANKPHQAWGFKTLFRNDGLFRKMGVHRPNGPRPHAIERINWVNGSGQPMPRDQWRTAWRSHAGTYGYDLVSLNHYAVRSAQSFLVKRDRGRVNHVDRDQGMAYWFRMNHNVVHDDRATRMRPALQAEFNRLMADPEIAAAHHACVAAHRARIAALMAQPEPAAFHAALTSPRSRALSRLHGHFGANVYLAGPQVIPDAVAARDPDDDFFFTVEHSGEAEH